MASALGPADRLELMLEWEGLRGCVEPFKFDSHRLGLCLLIGYLLEGIASRSHARRATGADEVISEGGPR